MESSNAGSRAANALTPKIPIDAADIHAPPFEGHFERCGGRLVEEALQVECSAMCRQLPQPVARKRSYVRRPVQRRAAQLDQRGGVDELQGAAKLELQRHGPVLAQRTFELCSTRQAIWGLCDQSELAVDLSPG